MTMRIVSPSQESLKGCKDTEPLYDSLYKLTFIIVNNDSNLGLRYPE